MVALPERPGAPRPRSPSKSWRTSTGPSRRWALAAAAGLVGGVALGALGEHAVGPVTSPASSWSQETIRPEAEGGGSWVDTGFAGGLPLFLVRRRQTVRALSSISSDKPYQLHWNAAEGRLSCPWGRYQSFSLTGASIDPKVAPLPLAEVRVVDGRVQIYGVS